MPHIVFISSLSNWPRLWRGLFRCAPSGLVEIPLTRRPVEVICRNELASQFDRERNLKRMLPSGVPPGAPETSSLDPDRVPWASCHGSDGLISAASLGMRGAPNALLCPSKTGTIP